VAREILAEFVVNAVKHAQAEEVSLVLEVVGDRVELTLSNSNSGADATGVAGSRLSTSDEATGRADVKFGVGFELIESVLLDHAVTITDDEYRLTGAIPLEGTTSHAEAKSSRTI
jgi:anti-sigma regulatory factor (Ser/Thr protein kinase)